MVPHVVIEPQVDVVGENTRCSGGRAAKHIGDARRCGHDGVIGSSLLFLVYLVETMADFVGSASQEGPRYAALLLIRCCSKVYRLRRGVSVIAEASDTLARNGDLVVHYPSSTSHGRGDHDKVHSPFRI